jgi:hypothetical protein
MMSNLKYTKILFFVVQIQKLMSGKQANDATFEETRDLLVGDISQVCEFPSFSVVLSGTYFSSDFRD